jgi:hypothetical protein
MTKWHDEVSGGGDYISTKVGTDITMEIVAINKITNKPDFEPKTQENIRQGFVFEFVGPEGIVTASTFALQSALKNADVATGDKIRIQHPKTGEYIVTKLPK